MVKTDNHFKRLAEMRAQVKAELEHIPRRDFNQNILRAVYWADRMHSFKIGETKEQVLEKAVKFVRKDVPEFVPSYDSGFFKVKFER